MNKILFGLCFIAATAVAEAQQTDYRASAVEASRAWIDLDYVGDGLTGHRLDIFLPKAGKGPFPVVISVYGSAWFANNLKGTTFTTGLGQALLEEGFAVVSVNYRSSSDARFPAQIQDVKAAIRFIRGNSEAFSIDSHFIGITGWSSGGHLSALAGTTNNIRSTTIAGLPVDIEGSLGKFTGESSNVNAVVDWFGPTDFLIMDSCGSSFSHNDPKSPESSLIGGPIQENKDKVALANPVNYVVRDNPPFLIFHGDKDPLVPHCESERLYARLQAAGVASELVLVAGGAHGPGVMIKKYYERMIAFFKNQLKQTGK